MSDNKKRTIEELTETPNSPEGPRLSSTCIGELKRKKEWFKDHPEEWKRKKQYWKNKMEQWNSEDKNEGKYENKKEGKNKHAIMRRDSFLHYLLFFIILAVILYLIFYFFKFSFVQNKDLSGAPTGEVNQGKAIGWAIVISLIIVALVYLLMVPRNRW